MNQKSEQLAFLEAGVAAHNSGDLKNAEVNYRNALAIDPHNPDALHLLGYLAFQLGFTDEAISLIEDAIKISPKQPLYFNNLASVFLAAGKNYKAIAAYRSSIGLKDNDPDVLNDLGNLLRESVHSKIDTVLLEDAERLIRRAIEINPDSAKYHNNLGNVLRDLFPGDIDRARKSYNRALELNPNLAGALGNLGLLAQMEDDLDLAEEYFERAAVEQSPDDAEALNNYAQLLEKKNRLAEAVIFFEKAGAIEPQNYMIGLNKARALMQICRYDEALDTLRGLMELDPSRFESYWVFTTTLRKTGKLNDAVRFVRTALEHFSDNINLRHELASIHMFRCQFLEAEKILQGIIEEVGEGNTLAGGAGLYSTLGVVYLNTKSPEQIIEMFETALAMEPDNGSANFNYALSLLSLGLLEEGWKRYRRRWESNEIPSAVRPFQKPVWQGQPTEGKTIVLWGEQGIGDEIRFASLIPEMMGKGANIIIECDPRLVGIFKRSFHGTEVIARESDYSVPYENRCDYQIPVLDLAGYFRPTIESFPPAPYAYLKPDPERLELWRDRIGKLGRRPKVGLLWRGMLTSDDQTPHYASVEELAPVLAVQGIDFINLMYAECADDLAKISEMYGVNLLSWEDLDLKNDQDGLAALVANVDLVITPKTATGYLAAALDVPVFNFITTKRAAELLGDPEAPGWAPSMRHFIKDYEESWDRVMNEIAGEIKCRFALS